MIDYTYEAKAKEIFDDGYRVENKNAVGKLISLTTEQERLRDYYNTKCRGPLEKELTTEDAEKVRLAYLENYKEWAARIDEEVLEPNPFAHKVLWPVLAVLLYGVWKTIRYVKLLKRNYEMGKEVDSLFDRKKKKPLSAEALQYREQLKDINTCPKEVKHLAYTTKVMVVAGIVMLINSIYNLFTTITTYGFKGWGIFFIIPLVLEVYAGASMVGRKKRCAAVFAMIGTVFYYLVVWISQCNSPFVKEAMREGILIGAIMIMLPVIIPATAYVIYESVKWFYMFKDFKNIGMDIFVVLALVGYILADLIPSFFMVMVMGDNPFGYGIFGKVLDLVLCILLLCSKRKFMPNKMVATEQEGVL